VINIDAKKPPTAAMKKRAHDLWLFMLDAEEWLSEKPNEIWPLFGTGEQLAVFRVAKALGPWLHEFVEQAEGAGHSRRGRVQ